MWLTWISQHSVIWLGRYYEMAMRLLDLFSGIGGFSYAAEKLIGGYETVAFCEMDEFCQKVLKKHWPQVPIYDDVRTLDAARLGRIDIVTGGYPCQPFSQAGRRQGEEDERHLWPEMLRIIKSCKPRYVLAENVAGHVTMGLDQVLTDLEDQGYTTRAIIVPACAKNAPHRRDRVWIIGQNVDDTNDSTDRAKRGKTREKNSLQKEYRQERFAWLSDRTGDDSESMADTSSLRGQNISRNNKKSATRSAKNENVEFGNSCTNDRTSEIVADSDSNGHERRWSETRNENTTRQNTQGEWSANTKDINRQGNDGLDRGEPRVDGNLSGSSDRGTTISADTTGVRGLSKDADNDQGTSSQHKYQEDNNRTLVSQGQKGLQLSEHRGLAADQTIAENNKIRSGDDNDSIERMENKKSNVADTNNKGLERHNEHSSTINRQNKRTLIGSESGSRDEIVANTESIHRDDNGIVREHGEAKTQEIPRNRDGISDTQGQNNVSNSNSQRGCSRKTRRKDAKNVGERSKSQKHRSGNFEQRMGYLDNGLSAGLLKHFDREPEHIPRVTKGEKDRAKKLKALGNSIVPQVAAEILLAIRVSEESD